MTSDKGKKGGMLHYLSGKKGFELYKGKIGQKGAKIGKGMMMHLSGKKGFGLYKGKKGKRNAPMAVEGESNEKPAIRMEEKEENEELIKCPTCGKLRELAHTESCLKKVKVKRSGEAAPTKKKAKPTE